MVPGPRLYLRLSYREDLFERQDVELLAQPSSGSSRRRWQTPDLPICRIDMLTEAERTFLLEEVNATTTEVPDAALAALFESQVAAHPESPAVLFGDQVLSYGELNAAADALAHGLIRRGVGPEDRVALLFDLPQLVVAMIA